MEDLTKLIQVDFTQRKWWTEKKRKININLIRFTESLLLQEMNKNKIRWRKNTHLLKVQINIIKCNWIGVVVRFHLRFEQSVLREFE